MTYTEMLPDARATEALGARLAARLGPGTSVWLEGDLGAGKTTLVRGFLRARGCKGAIKSPTYTLIEPYELAGGVTVYHLDLYRLADPEELEWLGARDLFRPDSICLIEWPERGAGYLPAPDLTVRLAIENHGRRAVVTEASAAGKNETSDESVIARSGATKPSPNT